MSSSLPHSGVHDRVESAFTISGIRTITKCGRPASNLRYFPLESNTVAFRQIEFARIAMAGIDSCSNGARRQRIADRVHRDDARGANRVGRRRQGESELVVRQLRRHCHHRDRGNAAR
jgi:hypothetical protein